MNNERYQEIIDEAYDNYSKEYEKDNSVGFTMLVQRVDGKSMHRKPNIEMFVTMCTYDSHFSERWGLKIGERELTLEERYNKWFNNNYETGMERFFDPNDPPDFDNPYYEPTPTKLITVTYQENKIEVYE